MPFLSAAGWLQALQLGRDEVPRLLVCEGTWWAARQTPLRLAALEGVRELALPGLHHGWYAGVPVVYVSAYGASRAVEPVHVFGEIGQTPRVVQVGSCGGLQPAVHTGDVVLPEQASIGEGASQYYGGAGESCADPGLVAAAERALRTRGLATHRGRHVTTAALLAQPPELIERWSAAGCLGVDMETSAVFSAAAAFGLAAASMLFCWDELLLHRSWLDPFTPAETAAQQRADHAIYQVALEIGCQKGTHE